MKTQIMSPCGASTLFIERGNATQLPGGDAQPRNIMQLRNRAALEAVAMQPFSPFLKNIRRPATNDTADSPGGFFSLLQKSPLLIHFHLSNLNPLQLGIARME